jgi:putative ABC transport system permease protein
MLWHATIPHHPTDHSLASTRRMTIGNWIRRIRYFLLRDRLTAELEEEMRIHRQFRADAIHSAGRDAEQARIEADRRFGNPVVQQEASRDMWGFIRVDQLLQDVRYAARRIRQRPGFACAVIGVMALGIGATTAMFSAVDAAMMRPLPFFEPDRLVMISKLRVPFDPGRAAQGRDVEHIFDYTDVAPMSDLFTGLAAYGAGGLNLADAERPLRARAGVVTASFFRTLGVFPARGRVFTEAEARPDAPPVVILSDALWQRHYGGAEMVGTVIHLNSKSYQVVGIMPRGFSFPNESDLWIPMSVPTTFATFEAFRGYLATGIIARVAQGMTVSGAASRLRVRWERSLSTVTGVESRPNVKNTLDEIRSGDVAIPLQRELLGDRRTALLVLLGATGLLLLIACANVTNLMLSQASMRRREIAVREVLGATRARIVRQLLAESVLLSAAGAVVGLMVAPLALLVMRTLIPANLAGLATATVDGRVLTFATLLALITGIGFGLWSALGGTRNALGDTIKSGGGHGATGRGAGTARRLLVGTELALTVMLLIGAGLMLRSFQRLMGLDRGLNSTRVGTLELAFPGGSTSRAVRVQRIEAIVDRLAHTPGIEASGVVNDLPLGASGGIAVTVTIDGAPPSKDMSFVRYLMASTGYFEALGIRLLRGRTFSVSDDSLSPKVAVISSAMARRYWPNLDALGRRFRFPGDTLPFTVIGIVADVRERSLDREPDPQMYFPVSAMTPMSIALVARSALTPKVLLARMTDAVRAADPTQAVYNLRTMDDVIGASVAPRRANTILITSFAALALVLAALGVYAVVEYGVAQRARELGIRAALGATGLDLLRLVANEMVVVVASGLAVGLGGAWAMSRVLESLVYGVTTHDARTFIIVPIALGIPAAVATLWPAHRAMTVNPTEVMRAD